MKTHMTLLALISLLNCNYSYSTQMSSTHINFNEITIKSIHEGILNKKLSCEHLIRNYLRRIKKYNLSVDDKAPINAFTELNSTALTQAHKLDEYFKQTKKLAGPLHCIPVVVKDNIDSVDMTTSSGSYSMLGSQPNKNAFIVQKLREAGSIIIGKGGMDEFAWGMFGISSRNGRIGNPFDTSKNPGGSSGGSAAAVSANFALLGIGTDNSGSVRIPAAFNGLLGLRPSTGLISQSGIFPMGSLDGAAGPMARSTAELAIMLDVIAKTDPNDIKTQSIDRPKTYKKFLKLDGLKNKRVGVVRAVSNFDLYHGMPTSLKQQIQQTINTMKIRGANFVDINFPDFSTDRSNNQAGEIQDVNQYLASFPSTRKNFKDICQSNRTRTFGTVNDCLNFIKTIASKEAMPYKKALAIFSENKKYIHKIMDRHHLDALLMPISTNGTATYDAKSINTWQAPISSNSGLPSITFNIGYRNNMPIGIELVGKQFHEGTLIEIAYAYEKSTTKRKLPVMPKASTKFQKFSIPEMNNLFTLLGANTYSDVIKNIDQSKDVVEVLTPERFRKITYKTLNEVK